MLTEQKKVNRIESEYKIYNKCTMYNAREPPKKTLKGDFAASQGGLSRCTQIKWFLGQSERRLNFVRGDGRRHSELS
jgi:hypothetical protein